ncbi:16S rRNA (cytosine(967)-C(5))-methyltransferase RsmB [Alkaliphilus serpentinus]|uniref:16S rRNA (cytosine(967)-C(5))-methyltransferase n=1 Tax=Alkaliphilus serpentinus TaxID=1482731 RepID=A0A833HRB0_9FIRM|nr:16S rRNA (cytosine(967)-C(5))-methyltransferase RsmB [Alkaliphilus serpentinus]KAB3533137.1 16S rRNA (cytosine(967)-C(5))-methyltransferase RsmB [Alkaliphilus serpentinus]
MTAREGALRVLYQIDVKEAYSNIALNREIKENPYTPVDRGFLTELVYGVLENQMKLDYIIGQFSSVKLKKIHPYALILIRLALYQLLFLDKIPPSAAINESVELSKKYCKKTSGFINGVLRNILRKKGEIHMPSRADDLPLYLSLKYSHPLWMVNTFLKFFDPSFTEKILEANNGKPELYVRVNTLKASVADVLKSLEGKGFTIHRSGYIDEALVIKGEKNLQQLEELKKGHIYIQDFASMLIAKILDPKEGDFVIDVCSAPGGKTTHIAQLMKNQGRILARDIHPHKLKLVQSNGKRLGVNIIETQEFNGIELDENLLGKADGVLVDAPCSGLGIIRRKPEIKYRKTNEDIKALTEMQAKILSNAAKYLKIGGTIVYSTCTIDPRENHKVVETFLNHNKNYQLIDISKEYHSFIPGNHQEAMLQLYPGMDGTDGFFISKIIRKS